jgi:hypothetical protein
MIGRYVPRNSLRKLGRQYFRYGFYRARTFRRHPQSMRRSHLIAPVLAASLPATVAGTRSVRFVARTCVGAYLIAVLVTGASTAIRTRRPAEGAMLAAVLPTMHLGWGFGTLVGMARFGPPVAAFARVLGLSDGGAAAHEPGPVYAPSLYGVQA